MSDPVLPACPFCGFDEVEVIMAAPAARRSKLEAWHVSCAECGASAASHETREDALNSWARREAVTGQAKIVSDDAHPELDDEFDDNLLLEGDDEEDDYDEDEDD